MNAKIINEMKGFGHVNRPRTMGACSGLVRSEPVLNRFYITPGPLNREPNHWSGSQIMVNLGLNHSSVRLGSGSNQGSEPNLTIPEPYKMSMMAMMHMIRPHHLR
jgi:hypothetical protein